MSTSISIAVLSSFWIYRSHCGHIYSMFVIMNPRKEVSFVCQSPFKAYSKYVGFCHRHNGKGDRENVIFIVYITCPILPRVKLLIKARSKIHADILQREGRSSWLKARSNIHAFIPFPWSKTSRENIALSGHITIRSAIVSTERTKRHQKYQQC